MALRARNGGATWGFPVCRGLRASYGLASVLLLVALPAASDEGRLSAADINAIVDELQRRGLVMAGPNPEAKPPSIVGDVVDEMEARASGGAPTPPAVLAAGQAEEGKLAWYDRISFHGDFRGRVENFWIKNARDRNRLRYRLRIGADADVNDYVQVSLRLATGEASRSGNQTLGRRTDFDPDKIFIDQAFVTLMPFGAEGPPVGDAFDVKFGKFSNPFRPKVDGPSSPHVGWRHHARGGFIQLVGQAA